jgi:hypothetical protein
VTLESWSLRALGARNATRGDRIGRGRPALPRSPYPAAVAPRNRPAMLESPRVVVPPCRGLLVWSPRHATVAPCGRPAMPRLPRVVALRVRPVVLRSPRARGLQGAMVAPIASAASPGNHHAHSCWDHTNAGINGSADVTLTSIVGTILSI